MTADELIAAGQLCVAQRPDALERYTVEESEPIDSILGERSLG